MYGILWQLTNRAGVFFSIYVITYLCGLRFIVLGGDVVHAVKFKLVNICSEEEPFCSHALRMSGDCPAWCLPASLPFMLFSNDAVNSRDLAILRIEATFSTWPRSHLN